MRRISTTAMTAAFLVAASLPSTARAARPDNVHDSLVDLGCQGLTSDVGTASIYVGVSATYGGYVELRFWEAPNDPFETDPTWISTHGDDVALSGGGDVLTASFNLVEYEFIDDWELPYGDPVGTATLTATLSPAGEVEAYSSSGRDGNRLYSFSGTSQAFAVAGILELPDGTSFEDLSGCSAVRHTSDIYMTNPTATISAWGEHYVSCFWGTEDAAVGLNAVDYGHGSYSEVWMADASGFTSGYTESPHLTTSALAAEYLLTAYDELSGTVDVVGTATASATLTTTGRFTDIHREGETKVRVSGHTFAVAGSLTIETQAGSHVLAMDDASCFSQAVEVQSITANPSAGRGPTPANDGPGGAVALEVGDSIRVRTIGAAHYPEAPCVVDDPGYGEIEIPLGKTLWYAVMGTGDPVTIDTAGSDFDTVLGIYTGDGSDLTQVACVDDVFSEEGGSLQAAVTFATEAGTTYFVQAGGYSGSSGTLRLSVN